MTLEKAIELVKKLTKKDVIYYTQDNDDALLVLIEAGKEVLKARDGNPALDGELLPGETEE